MENKICNKCKQNKTTVEFNKNCRKSDGLNVNCKICEREMRKSWPSSNRKNEKKKLRYDSDQEYREIIKARRKRYHREHTDAVLWSHAKIRARKAGLPFDLEISDVKIPDKCPILEIPIYIGNELRKWNSPSIDKIDNQKGYTKDNIRVISYMANHMKAHASKEELLIFAKNIVRYVDRDIVQSPK